MRETTFPYFIKVPKFSNKNNYLPAWRDFEINFSRPLFTIIFRPKIVFLDTDSILRVWISQVRRVKDFSVFLKGEMVHILFSKLFWPTLRKYDLMIEIVFEIWGWSLRVCKSGPLGILFRCIVLGKVIWHICWIMEIFFMRLSRL